MLDIPCTPRPIPLAMTAPGIISDFDGYGSNTGNLSFGNAAWKYDTSQVFGNYGAGLMVLMVGKLVHLFQRLSPSFLKKYGFLLLLLSSS